MTTSTIENRFRLGHPDHDDFPAYRLLRAPQLEIVQGVQLDQILAELYDETAQTIPEELLRGMSFDNMHWQHVSDTTGFIPTDVFLGFTKCQLANGDSTPDTASGAIALQRKHNTLSNQARPHQIKLSGLLTDSKAHLHVVDLAYNANGGGELYALGVSKPEPPPEQPSHSLIALPIDYHEFLPFAGIITPEMVSLTDDGLNGPHRSMARADFNYRFNRPSFNGTGVRNGWESRRGMGIEKSGTDYRITSEQPGGIVEWQFFVPAHLMEAR